MFACDNLFLNETFTYYDVDDMLLKIVKLNSLLFKLSSLLKKYKIQNNRNINKSERILGSDITASGYFIIDLTPTCINKRFKRNFGKKLKWFNFTPKIIRQFSKLKYPKGGAELSLK